MAQAGDGVFLAFDLGGTRIKAGLLQAGDALAREVRTVPTPQGPFPEVFTALVELGRQVLGGRRCEGLGLCVPGLVDEGRVVELPGKLPGVVGFDLRGQLAEAFFAPPPVVVNDALAYGVGESTRGAGRGFQRTVVITLGTGVGVAVLEEGVPVGRGHAGSGILGGFIPIIEDPQGPRDSNDQRGTIEALCASRRIVDRANAAGGRFDSVEEVFSACARGDPAAKAGVEVYRRHLARALVALACAHGPSAIVLGGGPMVEGNPVLPGLEAEVNRAVWKGGEVRLVRSSLGDGAALAGLAELHARRAAKGSLGAK